MLARRQAKRLAVWLPLEAIDSDAWFVHPNNIEGILFTATSG